MKKTNVGGIVQLVLKAVALAMGVATVVLSILGAAETGTLVLLLGIGLAALGLAALDQIQEV
jgi:small-conductance mechanosensitive channel